MFIVSLLYNMLNTKMHITLINLPCSSKVNIGMEQLPYAKTILVFLGYCYNTHAYYINFSFRLYFLDNNNDKCKFSFQSVHLLYLNLAFCLLKPSFILWPYLTLNFFNFEHSIYYLRVKTKYYVFLEGKEPKFYP